MEVIAQECFLRGSKLKRGFAKAQAWPMPNVSSFIAAHRSLLSEGLDVKVSYLKYNLRDEGYQRIIVLLQTATHCMHIFNITQIFHGAFVVSCLM